MGQKIKKPPITITELLAINKTADCRKLLQKHGVEDAKNYEDLQDKLVELYRSTPDKRELEKQVALMHPHKEFILKYCAPPVKIPEDIKVGPGQAPSSDTGTTQVSVNDFKGDEGNRGESKQRHSCACGCGGHSGFDGPGQSAKQQDLQLLALVSMVAIVALIIYSKK